MNEPWTEEVERQIGRVWADKARRSYRRPQGQSAAAGLIVFGGWLVAIVLGVMVLAVLLHFDIISP
jgi:hypothetical protein